MFFPPRGRRHPRAFNRGFLKFALLDLLQEHPKHGYEMMKELEQRAGGMYTPSAGAIYPTLQMLEDRGWVTSETIDGKKVYTITAHGRAALEDHLPPFETEGDGPPVPPWAMGEGPWGHGPFGGMAQPEVQQLRQEIEQVAHLTWQLMMRGLQDSQIITRITAIVARTRVELEALLNERQGRPTPPPPPPSRDRLV